MRAFFVHLLELIMMAWLLIVNIAVMIMCVPIPVAPPVPVPPPTPVIMPVYTTVWVYPTTATPEMDTSNIPPPVYYPCSFDEKTICIKETTSPIDAISMTFYMEVGDIPQGIADVMQLLDNAMRCAWDCWSWEYCSAEWRAINTNHVGYDKTTRSIREQLALYLMSRPYPANGYFFPAWNAWSQPFPIASLLELPYSLEMAQGVRDATERWLENPDDLFIIAGDVLYKPNGILVANRGIIYDYASSGFGDAGQTPELERNASYIYRYTYPNGAVVNMYYSTYGYIP